MDTAAAIFIFITGLVIGSFLNVMALRLLSEENFVTERSKCPQCGEKIAWYDNIPVLSYLFLWARCRHCKAKIGLQYPVVELLTGALFVFIYLSWGLSLKTLFLMFLTANLIVITITDLKEKVIFDINSIPIIPLGLVYNFFSIGTEDMFMSAIIGAIVGAAFFEIFSRIGLLLAGEYAFGGGDTLLGAALGAWFGWKFLVVILVISLFIQVIIGVPLIFYNLHKNREYPSLLAMTGLLASLGISFASKYLVYAGRPGIAIIVTILVFALAGFCIYVIFKRMRETSSHTFLPFGPPLVVAGFIVMFFPDFIAGYIPF